MRETVDSSGLAATMSSIVHIQRQISALYASIAERSPLTIPLRVQAGEWLTFANSYSIAATLVAGGAEHLWLPRLQLTGHAVELALKACLAAASTRPPNEHDLVRLCILATDHGYVLSQAEQAAIVHLTHFYHRDLATRTKFKARYPTPNMERLGGAVPYDSTYRGLVQSLCEQAEPRTRA